MIKPASEALAANYEENPLSNYYISECSTNYDKTLKTLKQCTLKRPINITGKGRYRSKPVKITLRPAPINTGVLFRRIDLNPITTLTVDSKYIYPTKTQTNLIQQQIAVYGIEHLMSALAGLGIDNILVDIDGAEMPLMDGSTEPFVFLMQSAGIQEQAAAKRFIRVREKIQIATHDAWAFVEPSDTFQITCTLSSPENAGFHQQYSATLSTSIYSKSLSRARGHTEGLSLSSRRYADENIRHHVLDTIGDFYMLGYPTLGSFKSHNTNHTLNHRLICKLLGNPTAWEFVEYSLETDHRAEFSY